MEDIDVWRTAQLLLHQHGDGAERAANEHRDAMVQRGDWVGVMTWHRVQQAIAQLRKNNSESGGRRH